MGLSSLLHGVIVLACTAAAITLDVASTGGNVSSPLQYGLMFEDINHSGDGGIYAELIQNRAFQGSSAIPSTIFPWKSTGGAKISLENCSTPLSKALPTSLKVTVDKRTCNKTVGISNPGYWGIAVEEQTYVGSFYVLGQYDGDFKVSLRSDITEDGFESITIPSISSSNTTWVQYEFTLSPNVPAPNSNNSMHITFNSAGVIGSSLSFNLISLFPPTYKSRPNGMRKELMEAMKKLNPSFLRMPGGNNLEGMTPPYYWKWNETIGPIIDRPGFPGTWTYTNTLGLGLTEFLFWCQDLDIEPILGIWAGLYINGTVVPEEDLGPYVQDGLNELEFIMGDETTEYGALRISLGYPVEGWKVNYVEVGNEDWLRNGQKTYDDYRFAAFYDAIKAVYPNMTVITSTMSTKRGDSAGDHHQYTRPDDFVDRFNFFDNGWASLEHKTLLSEYGCIQGNDPEKKYTEWGTEEKPGKFFQWPIWIGSVAEAIFLLGAERNTNKMIGAAYAPLFQNLDSYQWAPDMISFTADPHQTVLSTTWHVFQLLSSSRFSEVFPTSSDTICAPDTAFWVAGKKSDGNGLLKVAVYNATEEVPFSLSFSGISASTAFLTVLTAPSPFSNNSVGVDLVKTRNHTVVADDGGVFSFSLPEWSVAVLTTY